MASNFSRTFPQTGQSTIDTNSKALASADQNFATNSEDEDTEVGRTMSPDLGMFQELASDEDDNVVFETGDSRMIQAVAVRRAVLIINELAGSIGQGPLSREEIRKGLHDYRYVAPETPRDVESVRRAVELTRIDFKTLSGGEPPADFMEKFRGESYGFQCEYLQQAFVKVWKGPGEAPELYISPRIWKRFPPLRETGRIWVERSLKLGAEVRGLRRLMEDVGNGFQAIGGNGTEGWTKGQESAVENAKAHAEDDAEEDVDEDAVWDDYCLHVKRSEALKEKRGE